ncbi:MAG: cysteine desulfurase [Muricauda sp.]|nr:cysteine desulfurase family protein [Allomuricauda sp.]MBO6533952.1 cysteine desulfurase [Allomuricauda sp.]MBO6588807.1 cysteine desulfurase [Allomuricauda sp.]MBO6618054.1 cysteine desulfurase [Allomuricauda sp.]MBO6644345.1 cysteine desulfurase [Allomuricauda sp.]MBO6747922.1 cysteine desulfurase [Allomuricauda sp.]
MQKVYLDNAATTQVRQEVIERMQEALAQHYGNPSSTHSFGRSAKTAVEQARKTIAKTLNAQPSEIIFTSGGTEADNMILRCAVRDLEVKTIITSKIEHHAVLHTVEELEKEYGINLWFVDLDEFGNPNLGHLETLLKKDDSKKLVSLMHVNNEIGNITDIAAVGELCKANNALFHSDTVQSIGHYPWDVQGVHVDFLAAAAHKFHGPKGIGFAYIRKNSGLKPLILGGSQERGFRAGTESFHNIVGLEEAFVKSYEHLEEETTTIRELKRYFVERVLAEVPGAECNGLSGDMEKSTYTLANIRLPFDKQKGLMLLFHLDMKGIACSKGSACQSGSNQGSHVLNEILSGEELDKPSLRFSFSMYNTKEELDYTVEVLKEFANS